MSHAPMLHALQAVRASMEPGVYVATVDLSDTDGQRYVCEYVSRPDDSFGLAPQVRAAIEAWVEAGNTVGGIDVS